MNGEQKEVMVTQPQQQKKKNKALPIILALIIIALLAGGTVLATQVLKNEEGTKTEEKHENKQEENNDTETNAEENEETSDGTENQEESKLVVMNDYFLNYNLNLTTEDCVNLIKSTDYESLTKPFLGEMYKTPISNEFKLYYTLNFYTITAMENMIVDIYNENLEVKVSTIETIAKKIFVDFEMPTNLDKEKWYVGTYGVVCDNEKCNYSITTAGNPAPFTTGYITKPEINGNVITVKPIYVTYDISAEQQNTEELEIDVTLYDTATLKPIKEVKNYIPKDGETEEEYDANNYDALVGNYETLETYKYTFTNDFKLVSVEKE